ncbi:HNH endonuclease [Bacteroidota bacterium]
MSVKVKLKNRENMFVVMDQKIYDDIQENEHLMSLNFLDNLRAHSNGYAVYQRCITTKNGPVYETIYLHKYIANKFVKKEKTDKKLFVRFIDGDVLNARVENLEWVTMNVLRRQMKNFKSKTGYRGVTKEKNRFRAVIYHERKAINLGFFDTAEEAAKAYNKKSKELFGETGSLNVVC